MDHDSEFNRLIDAEYIRLLDSLARFYNSQITAHVGYLLTSALFYFAFFSLGSTNHWFDWFEPKGYESLTSFLLFIILGVLYVSCGFYKPIATRLRLFPVYLYARLKYYQALSEIIWQHMGIATAPRVAELLKKRATRLVDRGPGVPQYPLGIMRAVTTMFEAKLYLSSAKAPNDEWKAVFDFEDYSREFNLTGYKSLLTQLLLVAYFPQLKEHQSITEEKTYNMDYRIGRLFKLNKGLP